MSKQPPRQWVIDSDNPYIERTPEEARAYFKRRHHEAGVRLRARAHVLAEALKKLSEPDPA